VDFQMDAQPVFHEVQKMHPAPDKLLVCLLILLQSIISQTTKVQIITDAMVHRSTEFIGTTMSVISQVIANAALVVLMEDVG
jgi:hypothetical protein